MKKDEPRREGANSNKSRSDRNPSGKKPVKLSPGGRPLKGKPKPKPRTDAPSWGATSSSEAPRTNRFQDGPRNDRSARPNDRNQNDRPGREDNRNSFRDTGRTESFKPRPTDGGSRFDHREPRSFDRNDRPYQNDRRPNRSAESSDFRDSNRDFRGPREPREFRDSNSAPDARGPRQPREFRDSNSTWEPRGPRQPREPRDSEGYERRNSGYTKPQSAYKGGRPVIGNPSKRWHAPTVKTAETHGMTDGAIRLNRFLARAGICSRRDADKLIADGMVTVNGQVVLEMGHKVLPSDEVRYAGEVLKSEKKVYLVLNKPKGFITSMDDEKARKTVMELVRGACRERIYPVGRLDRATTGVLLFTNDGDLAKKLTHPSHGAKKIYSVSLDKPLSKAHFAELAQGIQLEDGPIKADEINQVDAQDAREIGISLHSGRNRIVRRMFEHLGYEVVRLDRVQFGPITKKNLTRGQYRFLNEKEVAFLSMIG